MKKILSLLLTFVFLFSFVSCKNDTTDKTDKPSSTASVKFGMGVVSSIADPTSAKGDTNGSAEIATTAAAVFLDKDGKITQCVIDTMENALAFSSKGKAIALTEPKTKYELGDAYGMVAYGGAKKEWYQQADSFVKLVKGKNLEEVKALSIENGKPSDEVANAGCTINIGDFVKAVIKAVENAKDTKAKNDNKLKLAFVATQSVMTDATADKDGQNEITIDITAAAVDGDKKVTDAVIDTVEGSVSFNTKGVTANKAENLLTKRQLGDDYGMVKSGLTDKEWYQQVDAFISNIIGKTAAEITALSAKDGTPSSVVTESGCTINILGITKSAAKAAS